MHTKEISQSLCTPLFSVPQTSHVRMASLSPEDPSRRLPQSVQKTSEPIAAMDVRGFSYSLVSIRNVPPLSWCSLIGCARSKITVYLTDTITTLPG